MKEPELAAKKRYRNNHSKSVIIHAPIAKEMT
jgi:hypothetical protein